MTVKECHETICNNVQGTWNLHNAALEQNLSLDFFTMLSSISGVVGQKGQANQAAANVFLDNFSVFRRSLGLPACSVDLGVVEDIRYIHEYSGLQQQLDTSIWTGINESLLHKILRFSIFQQISPVNEVSASQLITGIPVPQPADSGLARDARFGGFHEQPFQRRRQAEQGRLQRHPSLLPTPQIRKRPAICPRVRHRRGQKAVHQESPSERADGAGQIPHHLRPRFTCRRRVSKLGPHGAWCGADDARNHQCLVALLAV
jgi:KR domain